MLTGSNGEGILFFVTGLSVQERKETAIVVEKNLIPNSKQKKVHV